MIKITNTSFTGKVLHSFKTLDSTNNFAKVLINQKSFENGTLIHTAHQTEGRGQQTNTWLGNPDENIYVSFIFTFEHISSEDFFLLNKLSCISILNSLSDVSDAKFKIKWPNDIYYQNKKIAGILIENTISEQKITHSIIGIGVNVNQIDFLTELNATSLKSIHQKTFNVSKIINSLAKYLEEGYFLSKKELSALDLSYHSSLYRLNVTQSMLINDKEVKAVLRGVDKFGRLKLEIDGTVRGFDHHEVKWII